MRQTSAFIVASMFTHLAMANRAASRLGKVAPERRATALSALATTLEAAATAARRALRAEHLERRELI